MANVNEHDPTTCEPRARVVFVTRRFPPSVGGMETLAANVDHALRRRGGRVELVALRAASVKHLLWFLPWAAVRTAFSLARGGVECVICGDAITWLAVAPVVRLGRARSAVMVLGLDLTFPRRIYQLLVRHTLRSADRVVAISAVTATAAIERGIDPARVVVVKPGIPMPSASDEERAAKRLLLAEKFGVEAHVLVVVLLGRLVRRKGVAWFVEDVVPRLPSDIVYLIAGDGPMRDEVAAAVAKVGSVADVRMLGPVDDDDREILLMGSDVVVMANIHVPGDMEGFGLVAVEAASRGAVVVAARIEGLEEAVIDGVTGILVEPENAEGFADAIRRLEANRSELRRLSNGFREQTIHVHSVERMFAELPGAFGLDGSRR